MEYWPDSGSYRKLDVYKRQVQRALKLSISPSPSFLAVKISLKARASLDSCSRWRRKVSRIPVPTRSTRSGGPHTKLSILFNTSKKFICVPPSKQYYFQHSVVLTSKRYKKNRFPSILWNQYANKHTPLYVYIVALSFCLRDLGMHCISFTPSALIH